MSSDDQDELINQLSKDKTLLLLGEVDRVMLDYARKLTVDPASINSHDVDKLRDVGFDDLGIHDICAITAYFAFVNRMADGLGVQLEESFNQS